MDWEIMMERIYLPEIDPKTKLIEQFDGYFDLEDVRPKDLEDRLIDDQEYWGWPNGVAVETQVTKQADVIQLFNITNQFEKDVMEANFNYYEPRTQHGSSLSPSAYSIIASKVGLKDEAFALFEKSLFIDIGNTNKAISGGTFIGGIHTAACGAAWQIVVKGFAGMEISENTILLKPHLPEKWDSFSFDITYKGQEIKVKIDDRNIYLNSVNTNQEIVNFTINDKTYKINPKEELEIRY
jgi:kojibiose phosphorylase